MPAPRSSTLAHLLLLVALVFGLGLLVLNLLALAPALDRSLANLIGSVLLALSIAPAVWLWLRRAEKACATDESALLLRNSELTQSMVQLQRLRQALDRHSTVVVTDPSGLITEVNDGFCAISGYTRAELLGQSTRLLNSGHHPKEFFHDLWATIRDGRIWHGEIRNRRKDGTLYWRDTIIVPIFETSGRITSYIAFGYDTTARREQDEALNRLALVAQKTTNMVVITDPAGLILWVNEGFNRITGYTLAEVLGRKPGAVLQGPDTDYATVARIHTAIASGQAIDCELLNYTKDQRSYWLQLRIDPVHDEAGTLTHFIAIESDITRIRADRELLLEASSLLAAAGHLARLGHWRIELPGRKVFWSEIIYAIHEVPPDTPISLEECILYFHPGDNALIRAALQSAIEQGLPYDLELRI